MFEETDKTVEKKYSELVEQTILDLYFPIRTFILNNVTYKVFESGEDSFEPTEYEKGSHHDFYLPKSLCKRCPDYDVAIDNSIDITFSAFDRLGVQVNQKIQEIQNGEKIFIIELEIPFSNGKSMSLFLEDQNGSKNQFVFNAFNYGPKEFDVFFGGSRVYLNHQQFGEGDKIITSGGYEGTMNTIKEIKEQIQIFNDFVRKTEVEWTPTSDIAKEIDELLQILNGRVKKDGNEVAQGTEHTEDYDRPKSR